MFVFLDLGYLFQDDYFFSNDIYFSINFFDLIFFESQKNIPQENEPDCNPIFSFYRF